MSHYHITILAQFIHSFCFVDILSKYFVDMAATEEVSNIMIDEDAEINNSEEVPNVKMKPTNEQYEKIGAFYEGNNDFFCVAVVHVMSEMLINLAHNEDMIEKSVFNELWGNLAAQLNDIGPPAFTEAEWRRKWSIRKYNTKKRRLKTLANSEICCGKII